MKAKMHLDTQCVLEYDLTLDGKPHVLPIYATSSFEMHDFEHGAKVFSGQQAGHVYSRYGNPTVEVTARKIADLEGYGLSHKLYGFMTSSGMSAISVLLHTLLLPDDQILTQRDLYGGTTELLSKVFLPSKILTHFVDLKNLDQIRETFADNPNIKVLYLETPSNPLGNCIDIKKVTEIAHSFGAYVIVDNTFSTPVLQQPFAMDVDFVLHSTTKYLNGHGNSIAGAIVGKDETFKSEIWKNLVLSGANCNPFDAWLVYNGMKTLSLRMEKHSKNALALAVFLENHKKVIRVNYPGLQSHPDYSIAQSQMKNFGGMLSFEIDGGLQSAAKFINELNLITYAPTLGDVNSLVLHPRSSSHRNIDPAICDETGITQGLVRVSVGIEHEDDLVTDVDQALSKI